LIDHEDDELFARRLSSLLGGRRDNNERRRAAVSCRLLLLFELDGRHCLCLLLALLVLELIDDRFEQPIRSVDCRWVGSGRRRRWRRAVRNENGIR
jgi:hypothetical protein